MDPEAKDSTAYGDGYTGYDFGNGDSGVATGME